ncbi:MAG: hypothetical protein OSB70_13545 [Myxococcota bacterium]|jgi:predicted regulator of Ras-like GTPase activity (Roadblock/LC7/MglB family)|nr:hypothetical protein [Myxococcota bacterium]
MSLETILQGMLDPESGLLAAALMDADGIPVAEAHGALAASRIPASGLASLSLEFGRVLGEAQKASDAFGGGLAEEVTVQMVELTLVFTSLEAGLVLVVAMAPDGNLGKARYLIRRNLLGIREQI